MKKILFIVLFFTAAGGAPAQAGRLRDYDRQIIASCMVLEAGCDGSEGMQAVLNVILNRAEGYRHRMVAEVIKRGAFSCMAPVWSTAAPDYSPLIRRAQAQRGAFKTAVKLLSTMDRGLLWDNTYGATHYHASTIRPYWVSDMSYITTVGGHHFYTRSAYRYAFTQ